MAIDSDDNLYVAESMGGIWRMSSEGIVENLVTGDASGVIYLDNSGDGSIRIVNRGERIGVKVFVLLLLRLMGSQLKTIIIQLKLVTS